ncbi:hypothetical protein EJB05_24765, partial [Eragrostis curvula]
MTLSANSLPGPVKLPGDRALDISMSTGKPGTGTGRLSSSTPSKILYMQKEEKAQKQSNASRGTPISRATPPVHGWQASETTQLAGGVVPSLRRATSGPRSMAQASLKLLRRSRPGRASRLSQPSGRPASAQGKGSGRKRIGSVASPGARPRRSRLSGVVMNVTSAPRPARTRAMSSIGPAWPAAIIGTSTKCGAGSATAATPVPDDMPRSSWLNGILLGSRVPGYFEIGAGEQVSYGSDRKMCSCRSAVGYL